MEIAKRQAVKETKKKDREERLKESKQLDAEQEEGEEEEELPPLYVPDPPSPPCCGFYSQPDKFWLSMVHTHSHIISEVLKVLVGFVILSSLIL